MLAGDLAVTKASFAAFARARDSYAALRTGGALGRGNGPLVVSTGPLSVGELTGARVLLPGEHTTAALLFHCFHADVADTSSRRYDQLLSALKRREADAAVIIHELRFTYAEHGFHAVEDLGERFERETGLPVPLGGVFARRDLDIGLGRAVEGWIAQSLSHAQEDPEACAEYVRSHAQELDDDVTAAHIGLYVNEFSAGYGDEGERAIEQLLDLAHGAGSSDDSAAPIFV